MTDKSPASFFFGPSQSFQPSSTTPVTTPIAVDTQILDFLRSNPYPKPKPLPRPSSGNSTTATDMTDALNSVAPTANMMGANSLAHADASDTHMAETLFDTSGTEAQSSSKDGRYSPSSFKPDFARRAHGTAANATLASSNGMSARENTNGSSATGLFKVPESPAAFSPPTSRTPSRQNSSTGGFPVTILFSNPVTFEEDIIQSKLVALIPQHSLDQLMTLGESMERGNRRILDLGSAFFHTTFRLKQYLEQKAYIPFNPRTPLYVLNSTNTPREWSRDGPSVPDARRTTEETHKLFSSELMMYKRAAFLKYEDIRNYSSQNIRTSYPIFTLEVVAMLDRIYETASKSKDTTMANFIKGAAQRHAHELMGMPAVQNILRSSIGEDSPGRILLDMVLKTNSKARADLFLDSNILSTASTSKQLETPTTPMDTTVVKLEPSNVDIPSEIQEAEHLRKMYETILDGRLLVAKGNGYGTLLSSFGAVQKRNRDFKFERSELLLADFEVPSTRHNMIVINSRGQRGDILESFMVRVHASDIGIEGDAVHLGTGAQAGSIDREERNFKPIGVRGRSRSPEWR